jgi:dipeptidyl aminopeptidase/acylaminoacyl peptidase
MYPGIPKTIIMSPVLAILLVALSLTFASHAAEPYQKPPAQILEVLHAPMPADVWPNGSGTHLLLGQVQRYPSIADLAQPFLSLGGPRVNPTTNRTQLTRYYYAMTVKSVNDGRETQVELPQGAKLDAPEWSPDGTMFAIGNTTPNNYELLVGEAATGRVQRITEIRLNGVLGAPFAWMNNRTLLVKSVPVGRGRVPDAPNVPVGPVIQDARGQAGPVPTFQDMLKNPHDEDLFDYYSSAQINFVDAISGKVTPIGKPGVYASAVHSPDGKYLLVTRVKRPYSYVLPIPRFPREIDVWDRAGTLVRTVATLPLADNVPLDGVPTGPRSAAWVATDAATVQWVEALDGGDPKRKVPHRDRLMLMRVPFTEPIEAARTQHRFAGTLHIEGTTQTFLTDYDRDRRWTSTLLVDLAKAGTPGRQVWSRSVNDRYNDPGKPLTRLQPNGHSAVHVHNNSIFLAGQGASPRGDLPFLDRMKLDDLKPERLFRSNENEYETVLSVVPNGETRFFTRRESPTTPPNIYLRSGDKATKLTAYDDPTPHLRRIRKQLVRYKRADGVDLSFTLYLPPDYKEGTRLPTAVWAYPLDFIDASTAGQVVGSTQQFTQIGGMSHLFYLLAGYAVLDSASMPVVGKPEEFNNTYVDQIVSSAKAAIDKAVELGVTDPNRVGVGGHSYGAFMTANLLAHSDLFKAGVARSGAYNRTLTPFGFQAERRTYWEAADVYAKVSPFTHAHKIKEPILLIHGMADNNTGTFPIQSERMYQAIRGNGGSVRLVMLPHESHGYMARESIEHTLFEMISWFEKYVKNATGNVSSSSQ